MTSVCRDNWERLVAAVVKNEQIWQLCHQNSISTVSSDFSDGILSSSSNSPRPVSSSPSPQLPLINDSVVEVHSLSKDHSGDHPQNRSDVPMNYWEQHDEFSRYLDPNEHRAACEIWQHPDKSTPAARYKQTIDDRKMGLVRHKFMEAKRLSMNEGLRQSKEFQDALEVLSSNKDLFLKCLQEL